MDGLILWDEIPKHYPGINSNEFVIMPIHIHGIITVGAGPRACPDGSDTQHIENCNGRDRLVYCLFL